MGLTTTTLISIHVLSFLWILLCFYAHCMYYVFIGFSSFSSFLCLSCLSVYLWYGLVPEIKLSIDWLIDWTYELSLHTRTTTTTTTTTTATTTNVHIEIKKQRNNNNYIKTTTTKWQVDCKTGYLERASNYNWWVIMGFHAESTGSRHGDVDRYMSAQSARCRGISPCSTYGRRN